MADPAPQTRPDIVLGEMDEARVAAAIATRDRIYGVLNGSNLAAGLDGLISAWLSLAVGYHGTEAALVAAQNLVGEIKRLQLLEHPAGQA